MKLHDSLNRMKTLMNISEGVGEPFFHGSPYLFDHFDLSKAMSGEGRNKFGFGVYFTQNFDHAVYYASENSIGDKRKQGFNVYECLLPEARRYVGWEDPLDQRFQEGVCEALRDMGLESDADQIEQESGGNGYDMWTMRNLYEFLQHVVGGERQASEFIVDQGVPGVWTTAVHAGLGEDTIYVSYTDNIRIIDVKKVG